MNGIPNHGQSVLIVEDDPSIRSLVRAVLQRDGMEVDEAGSTAEAISKLRARPYSAVVLDLMLPDGNGADILRQLSQLPHAHHCVVVVSAASPSILDEVNDSRVRAKLRKPFDILELTEAVRGCVASAKAHEPIVER